MSYSVAGSHNQLIDTYAMDRGRVMFEIPIVTLPDPTVNRITRALQEKEIIFGVKSAGYGLCKLDIPIKNVLRASSDKMIKIVIKALGPHLAPRIGEEVLEVWEGLPHTPYFNGISEGFAPPENENDLQIFISGAVPFQPLPTPFQNVLLYDRYKIDGSSNGLKPGEYHAALIAAASRSDFLSTPENNRLVPGSFTHENLIPQGPNGLNPIELTLRFRNAALTRAMLGRATFDRNDHLFNRALLNANLREIEHSSQLQQSEENPTGSYWTSFMDWLKKEGITQNLSADKQNELNLFLGRLSDAAVDIYAFLMIVFTSCSGFSDQSRPTPIWVDFSRPKTPDGVILPGPFDCLETNLVLASTIGALILDRCLKFIINADPNMKKNIETKIFDITRAASDSGALNLMLEQIKAIITDPTSEVSRMMADLLSQTPVNRKIKEIGEMLGPHFVEKYASQWKTRLMSKKKNPSLDIFLEGLGNSQRERYGELLKKNGLTNFKFEQNKNGYRLVVSVPIEVEMIKTNDSSASTSSSSNEPASSYTEDAKTIPPSSVIRDIAKLTQLAEQFLGRAREASKNGDEMMAGKCLDLLINIEAEAITCVQVDEFTSEERAFLLKVAVAKGMELMKKGEVVKGRKCGDLFMVLDPEGSVLVGFNKADRVAVAQVIADKVRECVRDSVKLRRCLVYFFNLDSEGSTTVKIKGLEAEERDILAQAALEIVSGFSRDKKLAQARRCIDLFASLETQSMSVVKPEQMALLAQLLVEKTRDFLKKNEATKAGRCLDLLMTFDREAIVLIQTKEFQSEEQTFLAQAVLEKARDSLKEKDTVKAEKWLDLVFTLDLEGNAFVQIKGFSPGEKALLIKAVAEKIRAYLKQEGHAKIGKCLELLFALDSDGSALVHINGFIQDEKTQLTLHALETMLGFARNKRTGQIRRCLDLLLNLETAAVAFERSGESQPEEKELLAQTLVGKARDFVKRKETVKVERCFDLILILGLEGCHVLLKDEEQTVLVQAVVEKVLDSLKKGDKSKAQKCLDLLFMFDPDGSTFGQISGIPVAEKALLADAYFDKMEELIKKGDAAKAGKCLILLTNLDRDNRALLEEGRILCETLGGIRFVKPSHS